MNKRCWLGIVLLLLFPSLSWGAENLKLGDIAFSEGKYREARNHYRQAVVKNPKSVPAHLALGHALFALGEYKYAFVEIRKGLRYHASPQQIHPYLIDYYPSYGAFKKKLADLEKELEFNRDHIPSLFLHGYICYYSGKKRQARKSFRRLLKLSHISPVNRKWTEFYLDLLKEEKILRKSSPFIEGVYALKKAEYFKAYKSLLRVKKDQPSLGIPHLLLAHCYFAMGYYKLAFEDLRWGIIFRPHNKILNSYWKNYYQKKGEWLKFIIALEGHVSVNPDDGEARQLLLFVYYSFKRFTSAWILLEKLKKEGIRSPVVRVYSRLLSSQKGKLLARSKEKSSQKRKGKKKEKKENQKKSKKAKEGSKNSDQNTDRAPEKKEEKSSPSPKAPRKKSPEEKKQEIYFARLRQLGKIYFREGKYNSSLIAFNSLLPQDKQAYYEVGYVYFAKGMYERAGDMVREGLRRTRGAGIPSIVDYFRDRQRLNDERKRLDRSFHSYDESQDLALLFSAFLEYQLGNKQKAKARLHRIGKTPMGPKKAAAILEDLLDKNFKKLQEEEEKEVNRYIKKIQKLTKNSPSEKKSLSKSKKKLKLSKGKEITIDGKKYTVYIDPNGRKVIYLNGKAHYLTGPSQGTSAKKKDKNGKKESLSKKKKDEKESKKPSEKEKELSREIKLPELGLRSGADFELSPNNPVETPSE